MYNLFKKKKKKEPEVCEQMLREVLGNSLCVFVLICQKS